MRARQRRYKLEPYYDGLYAVVLTHRGNTYTLRTPGGITLQNRYNGDLLFPAYTRENQPVRSLWYASRQLLQQDRERQAATVGLTKQNL